MAVLMTPPYLQFFDANGAPLAGGKVYTYTATGTFSTNKATYTTEAGDVEHPNPVILDAAGRPDTGNGSIWLEGTYDFVVTDTNDVTIETTLNVTAFTALPSASNAYFESFSGTGSQTAFTTSDDLGTDEKAIFVWVDSGLQESVVNGDFATDSDWTKGTGWSIGSGVATAAGAISTAISQTSAVTIVEGQAYSVTYTITRSAGGLIPSVGGNNGTEQTASGTYTEVIIGGSTEVLAFTGNSFTGTLDDVSITVAASAGYDIQDPSNYTINGTSLTFATAPAAGTNNIYVSAPSLLVGAASSSAAAAAASAAAALASENQAGAYAGQLIIVSTTSVAIGTGSKVFTVGADLSLSAGQFILITSDANPDTNYMWGTIASYSSTTLTVTVASTGGSGTLADWTMYLTGERGTTGATGSIDDLSGVPAGTPTTSDKLIFDDVDDSNNTKSATIGTILALGGGSLRLIETQTASTSSSIDFTTGIDTTYDHYLLVGSRIYGSANVDLNLQFSNDAGSSWEGGTNYEAHTPTLTPSTATYNADITDGVDHIQIGEINTTEANSNGFELFINAPANSASRTSVRGSYVESKATICVGGSPFGQYTVAEAVDGIRLIPNSGTITGGRFTLYGIAHS